MFNIDRTKVEDEKFLSFANKHDIRKIVEPNNQVRWYVELKQPKLYVVNNFFYSLIGKIFKTKECASLHFQISGSLFPFSVLLICLISKLSYVASHIYNRDLEDLNRFSTRRICSREQRKKQLDWLATNTDDITSQSNSLFSLVRANNFARWKTGFKTAT